MSIFIFEDNIIQAEQMRNDIKKICHENNISYDFIEVTSRNERLIERISETTKTPIYFLDIEIKGDNRKGLEVAQQIRKLDENGIIVFVTTHANFAPISYQYMVSALTFIDKNLHYDKRNQLIKQCLIHYKKKNESEQTTDDFILNNKYTAVRVPFNEINYIKTSEPHRLVLITDKRVIQFYSSLKEVQQSDARLLRCHRSYLVNHEKIKTYDKEKRMVILQNNEEIPVSRRLVRKVLDHIKGES